jgi:phospholipid/cholesterol/gamma-HCH transport system substrate-binding protein
MPVLSKLRFSELSPLRVGIVAIVVLALAVGTSLNSGRIYRSIFATSYSAVFAEAGGLRAGDEVRLGGVAVGRVRSVSIEDGRVVAGFSVEGGGPLGDATEAVIKTATPLGTKFLAVLPAGSGALGSGERIPLERTRSPYDVQDLLDQLASTTGRIDLPQLGESLDVVADTFEDTPEELRGALDGLSRLSQSLASRDVALRDLLANANGVTGVLAERSAQLALLIEDGNQLLEELYARRETVRNLLFNITAVLTQLKGVVEDNQAQIGPAMDELEGVLDLLNANDKSLAASIEGLRTYAGSLGEAVGSGPWFFALVPNLAPTGLVQQTLPSLVSGLTPASPSLGSAVSPPR